MISLLFALALPATSSTSQDAMLSLCRPVLARRADGDISSISVDTVTRGRTSAILRGPMRALIGMGDPAPGMASTHHLIRQDYRFTCWVHDGRVRKVRLEPSR